MKKPAARKQPKKSQHDLFKETAKDHGCDEKFDLKKRFFNLVYFYTRNLERRLKRRASRNHGFMLYSADQIIFAA